MSVSVNKQKQHRNSRVFFLLCVACVLVNFLISWLASRLGLPIYLDSIGTIFAAAVGGFLPGVVTGFLTNLLKGFWDLSSVYFTFISILLALTVTFFAARNDLLRFPQMLFPLFSLALIGGGLGSVLTWLLNGGSFQGGAVAERLVALGATPFSAQLVSDFLLDVADKALSLLPVILVLRILPQPVKDRLSAGGVSLAAVKNTVRRHSLRTKVTLLILGLLTVISISVTAIVISLYNDSVVVEKAQSAYDSARLASTMFDADRVPEYLEKGEEAEGYLESDAALARIVASSEDIAYVYVYQIREDGCHVVLDPDTPDEAGSDPGDIVDFDDAFMEVLPQLLAGEPIEPIISNETYGWLLSVYLPVFDSTGNCQCYVGVDLLMSHLQATERLFAVKMISLFLGFTMLVTALAIWLAERGLIRPINAISAATTDFARRSAGANTEELTPIDELAIYTGDEIENLYHAVRSTSEEVVQNISDIHHKNEQITRLQSGLIMVLADMVESRDKCTGNHVRNTASYVRLILNRMREDGLHTDLLTDEYIADVVSSAPLHDVGKIKVSDTLLNKPGKLTEEEFAAMKLHTLAGGEIIDSAIEQVADDSSLYLNEAKKLTLYHHERWDGKGYPFGIRGEEIPLSARVMAVADVFDALVSRRSYKEGFPVSQALDIIREESGTHFDPEVVRVFLECQEEARAIAEEANIQSRKDY